MVKSDREMNLNTLLSKIDYKESEITKLNKNNHGSLIRINELEIEKEQLTIESNNSSKRDKIRINQLQTSINNIKNNIRKNNKLIPLF